MQHLINTIKTIDYLMSLITPEVMSDRFAKEKLYHKFKLIQLLEPSENKTNQAIQYILNTYFSESSTQSKLVPNQVSQNSIDLTQYYDAPEISTINKIFGFSHHNTTLSYQQLEHGYQQNAYIPDAQNWYYRLLWYHFKDSLDYQHESIHELTNLSDELLYEQQ